MSFFFDVWTKDGFVLASDVRRTATDGLSFAHKIRHSRLDEKIQCAIITCGDYFESSLTFFTEATARRDSFREIAHYFAEKWTKRFAGTEDFSAVHIVWFEPILDTGLVVPQCWLWFNSWPEKFRSDVTLQRDLASFSDPVPHNNHIPWQRLSQLNEFPAPTLTGEHSHVLEYLSHPQFTWNGDPAFWSSAASAVNAMAALITNRQLSLPLDDIALLTATCLRFLSEMGTVDPKSTVGLSPDKSCDIVIVRPQGIERKEWANLSQGG